MKKYFFLLVLAMTAIATHAEFNRLVFRTVDGEEQSIGIQELDITFVNDQMIARSEGESVKIALTSLRSMEFSNGDKTGLDDLLMVGVSEGKVAVYSVEGYSLGMYDSLSLAYSVLPQGVYVVRDEKGRFSKIVKGR